MRERSIDIMCLGAKKKMEVGFEPNWALNREGTIGRCPYKPAALHLSGELKKHGMIRVDFECDSCRLERSHLFEE